MVVAKTSLRRKSRAAGKVPSDPVVSVIMPVYNRAQRVHTAIKSVLAQTYQDYELIVVDDGSTDDLVGSLSTINDPRLRIISLDENKGASTARNTGISEARGTYIALLDSDDLWLPEKLERQVGFMRAHAGEFRHSCTSFRIVRQHSRGHETRTFPSVISERDLQSGCRVSPGATLMAEKSLFAEIGPLRVDLRRLEDWDWLLRCSKFSNLAVLGDVLSIVDYTNADHIDYGSVRESVDILKSAHFDSSGFWPSGARRRYLAALENELAATAFRTNKYGKALLHLLRSFSYVPYRNFDYFQRIFSAVFSTTFQSLSGPEEALGLEALAIEHKPAAGKILYVIDSLDRGGAEQQLALVLPRLAAYGWQPIIYCLRRAGVLAPELREAGVKVIGPAVEMSEGHAGRLLRLPLFMLTAIKLFLVILWQRPAIAHFFLPAAYLIGAPLTRLARVPVSLMSRRSLNRYSQDRPFARRREISLHRHITGVLANSRAIIRELVDEEECRQEKVGLIYNGVDLSQFSKTSRDTPRKTDGDETLRLIIVANLIPYKGHADLLKALAGISDRLSRSWRLECVGRDDGFRAALEDQAQQLGISDHVKFLGERTDVPDLLAQSEISILCSHEEGFSNAILEGMAAGLPMVVTDVGGNVEGVVHEKTGLVVPARNPDKLGKAILSLAKDPKKRHKMGKAGQKRVMERFSIDACVTNYVRLYEALLRGDSVGEVDGVGLVGKHDLAHVQ